VQRHSETISTPSETFVYVSKQDEGMMVLTDQSVIFVGQIKQVDIAFKDFAFFSWDEDETIVTIGKRRAGTPMHFDIDSDDWFSGGFLIGAALACYTNDTASYEEKIKTVDSEGKSQVFRAPKALVEPRDNYSKAGKLEELDPTFNQPIYSVRLDTLNDVKGFAAYFAPMLNMNATEIEGVLGHLPIIVGKELTMPKAQELLATVNQFGGTCEILH
jgi:hypothetical protein